MLPILIQNLGLPFCELIGNDPKIIDYYCDIYRKNDKDSKIAKNILINFI